MKKKKSYKSKYIKESLYRNQLAIPKRGKDITINTFMPEIFVSQNDNVFCYTGICTKENLTPDSCFVHPSYTVGKHSTDEEIINKTQGFYRLINGHFIIDDYLDNGVARNLMYKRLSASIRFPSRSGAYGVFVGETEDRELSRAVFGLCYDEVLALTESYAKALGSYTEFETIPALTRSLKTFRFCELTGVWIPAEFPYVAFDDMAVSLYGFYKHIKILTNCRSTSKVSLMLIEKGLDEYILEYLFDIEQFTGYHTRPSRYFFGIIDT